MIGPPIGVTVIELVREGDYAVVRAEINGRYIELIRELLDSYFSHAVHSEGIVERYHGQRPEPNRYR